MRLDPLSAAVEIGRRQVLLDLLEVRFPTETSGRRDHRDGRTARQHAAVHHPIDQVAVAEKVDLLDAGRAVGNAGAREERVHRTAALVDGAVDTGAVGEIYLDRL